MFTLRPRVLTSAKRPDERRRRSMLRGAFQRRPGGQRLHVVSPMDDRVRPISIAPKDPRASRADCLAPERTEKFIVGDQTIWILDQVEQYLVRLRRKSQALFISGSTRAPYGSLNGVNPEGG